MSDTEKLFNVSTEAIANDARERRSVLIRIYVRIICKKGLAVQPPNCLCAVRGARRARDPGGVRDVNVGHATAHAVQKLLN